MKKGRSGRVVGAGFEEINERYRRGVEKFLYICVR